MGQKANRLAISDCQQQGRRSQSTAPRQKQGPEFQVSQIPQESKPVAKNRDSMLKVVVQGNNMQRKHSAMEVADQPQIKIENKRKMVSLAASSTSVNSSSTNTSSKLSTKSLRSNNTSNQITPKLSKEDSNNKMNKELQNKQQPKPQKMNPTELMMIRYHQAQIKKLPECDQSDFLLFPEALSGQAAPEYSQDAYSHLRRQETNQLITNYIASKNSASQTNNRKQPKRQDTIMKEGERLYAICRVIELCKEKGYRNETLFIALNILDRYLSKVYSSVTNEQLPLIVTTCTIIAAKMEQPMTPSITRMIKLLTEDEKNTGVPVDKESVIRKEGDIIRALNFDFGFVSSYAFLERFLRLADMNKDSGLISLGVEILKLAAQQVKFLDHLNSNIAAATFVLCINLKEQTEALSKGNEEVTISKSLRLEAWTDQLITVTGIFQEDFKDTFKLLAETVMGKWGNKVDGITMCVFNSKPSV